MMFKNAENKLNAKYIELYYFVCYRKECFVENNWKIFYERRWRFVLADY